MGSKQTRWHRDGPLDVEILRTDTLLSAHQDRHRPAGADPLPVGVPSDIGVANAEGAVEAFARQDHVHNRVYPINRLAGIIATFATFDTDPSTPANMTDGDFTTETGEGIKSLAGVNGDIGTILFDMGAVYPVLIVGHINVHRSVGDGSIYCMPEYSADNVSFYGAANAIWSTTTTNIYRPFALVFTYARYFRLRFYSATVTINPSVFHVKVAEVQALQLL